jgi:transcriptional regulator with XRE-family HTH domain
MESRIFKTRESRLGAHLTTLRERARLSQSELARMVGVPQQSIAYWETTGKTPRSEVLLKLAKALGVRVEALLTPEPVRERRGGPAGKVREAFEAVSRLPRRQQEKILEVVEALVDKSGRNGH